jgi:hypothetical protein
MERECDAYLGPSVLKSISICKVVPGDDTKSPLDNAVISAGGQT